MTCSTHSRRACSRSAAGSLRSGLVIALGAWVCNRTPGGAGSVAPPGPERPRRVLQACALTGCPARPGSARLLGGRRPRAHAGVGHSPASCAAQELRPYARAGRIEDHEQVHRPVATVLATIALVTLFAPFCFISWRQSSPLMSRASHRGPATLHVVHATE